MYICWGTGTIAETNIDLTVRTRGVYVDEWRVLNEGNCDHLLIKFTLRSLKVIKGIGDISTRGRFALRKADWDKLANSLMTRIQQSNVAQKDVQTEVADLPTIVVAAAEGAIARETNKL